MAKNYELILAGLKDNDVYSEEEINEYIDQGTMPPVHTYKEWQRLGRQVRKGETAAMKIKIWKRKKWTSKEDREAIADGTMSAEEIRPGFRLVPAAFFLEDQTEPINA